MVRHHLSFNLCQSALSVLPQTVCTQKDATALSHQTKGINIYTQ